MSVSDVSGKAIANLATEELSHPNPVFHGDTLFCESEVLEVRPSKSKPDRGIVKVHTRVYKQDSTLVAEFKRAVLVPEEDKMQLSQVHAQARRCHLLALMIDGAVTASAANSGMVWSDRACGSLRRGQSGAGDCVASPHPGLCRRGGAGAHTRAAARGRRIPPSTPSHFGRPARNWGRRSRRAAASPCMPSALCASTAGTAPNGCNCG